MTDFLWRVLAMIAARPAVAALLIRSAQRRPYFDLDGYMQRWWLVPETRLGSIRVHHILREDSADVLHDHPANWRTIILRGWYLEEDAYGEELVRMPADTRRASAETLHRINRVSSGGVWTIFIQGPKCNRWGFMTGSPPRKVSPAAFERPAVAAQ